MNEIKIVGIIGSGKMGQDLFNYLSDFNFQLVWFTRNSDQKAELKKTFQKKIKRQLKHGVISQEVFDLKNRYRITDRIDDLSKADLIIESIIEDKEIKQEIFRKLDLMVKPSCIITSNSSSVLPSELSDISRPNRIVGLHFFFPVPFKNIVELITSDFTDEITIAKTRLFLQEIKKFFIEQNEKSAFILNRFLLQLQIEAYKLLKELNVGFKQMDKIAKQIIPEFGLFEMMDHVGHHTMCNAIMNYSRMGEEKRRYEPLLNELQHRKKDRDKKASHLFYDSDEEWTELSETTEQYILDTLNNTAIMHFERFTSIYQFNLFTLKKALEEYCGIVL